MKYFGFHTSISYGLCECFNYVVEKGATSFQIFLRNPKSINNTNESGIDRKSELIELKKLLTKNTNIKCVVHSPYVLNFCQPKDSYIYKNSIKILINDMTDAELGGIEYCIVHTGKNVNKLSLQDAMNNYAEGIAECINNTPSLNTKIVIETASGQGTEICWKLKNLGYLRQLIQNKLNDENDIERVKFCIDTCHITSASYDIKNDCLSVVKLIDKYLKWDCVVCIHINDNKGDIGCFVDRHADIGKGTLTKEALSNFIKYVNKYNNNLVYILETPCDEIKRDEQLEWLKNC